MTKQERTTKDINKKFQKLAKGYGWGQSQWKIGWQGTTKDTNKRHYKLKTVRGKLRGIYISEIFSEKIVSDTGMKWKVREVDK